jgi:Chitin synthase export chaperone
MTGIMIYHIRSKYTAVGEYSSRRTTKSVSIIAWHSLLGRKEIVMFFYLYAIIELLAFFLDSNIIPTANTVYPVSSGTRPFCGGAIRLMVFFLPGCHSGLRQYILAWSPPLTAAFSSTVSSVSSLPRMARHYLYGCGRPRPISVIRQSVLNLSSNHYSFCGSYVSRSSAFLSSSPSLPSMALQGSRIAVHSHYGLCTFSGLWLARLSTSSPS